MSREALRWGPLLAEVWILGRASRAMVRLTRRRRLRMEKAVKGLRPPFPEGAGIWNLRWRDLLLRIILGELWLWLCVNRILDSRYRRAWQRAGRLQ